MEIVLIRGAGDIASGIAQRLHRAGFQVVMSEIAKPSSIRREVCFSEAIYDREKNIEELTSRRAESLLEVKKILAKGEIPVVIDEKNTFYQELKPHVLVDAIIAKKNLGTRKDMAEIVICAGPGFTAGIDCHAVIETNRGHQLGKVIHEGKAQENTKVPGVIAGVREERVIYSPRSGVFKNASQIGDIVKKGEVIGYVADTEIKASIDGVLRGLLRDGYEVTEHFKIADIDPRITEQKNSFSVSDKARSIGGGVLEAILYLSRQKNRRELWKKRF